MTHGILNTRGQAFEAKFSHESELDFQAKTRGGALFGRWVASLLGLNDIEAQHYANRMVQSIIDGEAAEVVLGRIANDLTKAGKPMSERLLQAQISVCEQSARQALYA